MFSSVGHSSGRDGAIRNSSNSQRSGDVTVVISLNSMVTSGTGFQSKKTFSRFGLRGKTNWQTSTFDLHAQLPSSSAFLFADDPHPRTGGMFALPCVTPPLGLGDMANAGSQGESWAWISVAGELCLTTHDEQSLQAQAHDEPRQVTSQLLALPGAHGFRHWCGVLAQIHL